MLNLLFVLNPGSCGYFCLRRIIGNGINKESYMSLYQVKNVLVSKGYYCSCLKVFDLKDIDRECLTLIKSGKNNWHYVIIKKIVNGVVSFYDPLFVTLRRKNVNKFTKKWSYVCLFYTKV